MISWRSQKDFREWLDKAVKILTPEVKAGRVDTLIGAGDSGVLFAAPLAALLDIPVLAAHPADDRYPHRLSNSQYAGDHICFIDDHWSYGRTFTVCRVALAKAYHDAHAFRRDCKVQTIDEYSEPRKAGKTTPSPFILTVDGTARYTPEAEDLFTKHATKHIEWTYAYNTYNNYRTTAHKLYRADETHPYVSALYTRRKPEDCYKCPIGPEVKKPARKTVAV